MGVRPETVKKWARMTTANGSELVPLAELLHTGEAVDTNYGNDRRVSIGYIDEESGEDGVRIFVRSSPPREPDDDDPKYIVVLNTAEQQAEDSFETDDPTAAITQYRLWRTLWPEAPPQGGRARTESPVVRSPVTVDTLTPHWCGHTDPQDPTACVRVERAAKDCAKERGVDLTEERRIVLLAITDLWNRGRLDDYTMTGFLGPALHDAGYRDIDTEPTGTEYGSMTVSYIDPDHPTGAASHEFEIDVYGQDDPERDLMDDRLKEQIQNASPKQIDAYTKVLNDLLAIAPEGLLYLTVDRDLRQAVKERATGRWK